MFDVGGNIGGVGVGYWLDYYGMVIIDYYVVNVDGLGLVVGLYGGVGGLGWLGNGIVYLGILVCLVCV